MDSKPEEVKSTQDLNKETEEKILETKTDELQDHHDDQEKIVGLDQHDISHLLGEKSWKDIIIVDQEKAQPCIDNLLLNGFHKPSKIQQRTLPFCLVRNDNKFRALGLIAQSSNGSGKTLSYLIPSILRVDLSKPLFSEGTNKKYYPQVIIVIPVNELCAQVLNVAKQLADAFPELKISDGSEPAHVIIKTPSQISFLAQKSYISLEYLNLIACDEADYVISSGHKQHLDEILKRVPKNQVGLSFYSATLTKDSVDNMNSYFQQLELSTIMRYELKSEDLKIKNVQQYSKQCHDNNKGDYIVKLLKALEGDTQVIIFVNTKHYANNAYEKLKKGGIKVGMLSGNLDKKQRAQVMEDFRAQKHTVLITTNLLSRGFDQRTIGLVINMDIPIYYDASNRGKPDVETYLHRIGRTGRFGDYGITLNLYTKDEDKALLEGIENHYKDKIKSLDGMKDNQAFNMINDLIEEVATKNEEKRAIYKENIGK